MTLYVRYYRDVLIINTLFTHDIWIFNCIFDIQQRNYSIIYKQFCVINECIIISTHTENAVVPHYIIIYICAGKLAQSCSSTFLHSATYRTRDLYIGPTIIHIQKYMIFFYFFELKLNTSIKEHIYMLHWVFFTTEQSRVNYFINEWIGFNAVLNCVFYSIPVVSLRGRLMEESPMWCRS